MQESETISGDTPHAKYTITSPTTYKEAKHMSTKIHKSPIRAIAEPDTGRTKDSPSPTTYKTLEAFNESSSPKGKYIQAKDKRKCFVDTEAKLSISPGPCKHTASPKTFQILSKGFSSRGRIS